MRACLRGAISVSFLALFLFVLVFAPSSAAGQAGGTSGTVTGTVTDPSGAVVPGATVTIVNPVSQFERTDTTDSTGHFQITNVPCDPYHMTVVAKGFGTYVHDVGVHSATPVNVPVKLSFGAAAETVQVTSEDLINRNADMDTDIDRKAFVRLPLESQSSGLSSLVTMTTPGVAADSNGLFHGLGDHAENSFSVDGQPITDQQSKVFSNQIPDNSVQSMDVIEGASPAGYGDKTSLAIQVITRSGQAVTKPTGSIYTSYGSFGSVTGGLAVGYGKQNWGNFLSADGLNTGRFLDAPEFAIFHDKGNEENFFDRIDYQMNQANSFHVNLNYSRSWFQTPNTYDNLNLGDVNIAGQPVTGQTDQRSKIGTVDIAPGFTHILSPNSVWNLGFYYRRDGYNYYPGSDPFADLGPIQTQWRLILPPLYFEARGHELGQ